MSSSQLKSGRHLVDEKAEHGLFIELAAEDLPRVVKVFLYNIGVARGDELLRLHTLRVLYQVVCEEVPSQVRLSLLKGVIHEVKSSQLDPVCLLAVIGGETDPDIIDAAVTNFLELSHVEIGNPFMAVQQVVDLLEDPDTMNRGAVHAALAAFGDRRVCAILRTARSHVSLRDANGIYDAFTRRRQVNLATIDYLLGWIVDEDIAGNEDILELIAGALSAYLIGSIDSTSVHDTTFNFGPHCFPSYSSDVTQTYEHVMAEIEPLLARLEASDNEVVARLVEIIRDPAGVSLEELEEIREPKRRASDRRGVERRVFNIMPLIERRASERRSEERRQR